MQSNSDLGILSGFNTDIHLNCIETFSSCFTKNTARVYYTFKLVIVLKELSIFLARFLPKRIQCVGESSLLVLQRLELEFQ